MRTGQPPLCSSLGSSAALSSACPEVSTPEDAHVAGTLGVPLGGTRRVGGLLGVAGRLPLVSFVLNL